VGYASGGLRERNQVQRSLKASMSRRERRPEREESEREKNLKIIGTPKEVGNQVG